MAITQFIRTRLTSRHIQILLLILLISIASRWWFISGNNIVFFWDQARDAFISREIVENGDIKILGPSASGTKDMVYHGVFFYYLIGPLYLIFGGNPYLVTLVISFINALGVFAFYFFGKEIFGSIRTGLIAAFLYAVSGYSILFGVWLSNPTFAPLTILLFYLFLWKSFFRFNFCWIPFCALFLGLSIQSAVFTAYLGVCVLIGIGWVLIQRKNNSSFNFWLLIGVLVGILSILTMILGQYVLYTRGIFDPSELPKSNKSIGFVSYFVQIFELYSKTFSISLVSQNAAISICVTVIAIVYSFFSQRFSQKTFIALYLFAPLFLLFIFFRQDTHTLVGLSGLVYVSIAYTLSVLSRNRNGVQTVFLFLAVFTLLQMQFLVKEKSDQSHYFVVQKGTNLQNQIDALEYMYMVAGEKEFSISSLTNPLGMNTTWSYLFDWYSSENNKRLPYWYGPTQAGIFGSEKLREESRIKSIHFTILEPSAGIPEHLTWKFLEDERVLLGTISEERQFGSMRIMTRLK